MRPPMNEQLPIHDMFTRRLKLRFIDYDRKSATIRCDDPDLFKNPYGFAHGGFLYSIGHIAARNMALVCLNRHMQVVQSTCQFLDMARVAPITATARLLGIYSHEINCETEVRDGNGALCFTQTLLLQDTVDDGQERIRPKDYEGASTKYGGAKMIPAGIHQPFDDLCHIGNPTLEADGVHVSTDLYWGVASDAGYVHQGVVFTLCDNCAAACVALMKGMRPVTVSATINYLAPALVGPVTAVGTVLKNGNRLCYYDIVVRDGNGKKCAKAQYIMNCTPWPPQVQAILKKRGF